MIKDKKITAKEVYDAAKAIVKRGQNPTLAAVRIYLGYHGSQSTIHKYLSAWKWGCFQADLKQRYSNQLFMSHDRSKEKYSFDMLALQERNQRLEEDLLKLKSRYSALETKTQTLEQAYANLKEEREKTIEMIIKDKNEHIKSLRQELKKLN